MVVVSGLVFWLLSITWLLLVGSIVFGVFNLHRNSVVMTHTTDPLNSQLNSLVVSTTHTTANNLGGTGAMIADTAVIESADIITLKVNTPFVLPGQQNPPEHISLRLATGGAFELIASDGDNASDGVGESQVLLGPLLLSTSFGVVDGNSSLMTIFNSNSTASVVIATLSPGNWLISMALVAIQNNLTTGAGVQEFAIGLLPDSTLDVYSGPGYAVAGITLDATIPSVNSTVYATSKVETLGNKYVALQVVKANFGEAEVFSWTVNQLVVQMVKL